MPLATAPATFADEVEVMIGVAVMEAADAVAVVGIALLEAVTLAANATVGSPSTLVGQNAVNRAAAEANPHNAFEEDWLVEPV